MVGQWDCTKNSRLRTDRRRVPDVDSESIGIGWQTKSIEHPQRYKTYKVTMDGRLFKEDTEYELVPEEERPGYDEEIGGFENKFDKAWGRLRKIHHGWSDVDRDLGIYPLSRLVCASWAIFIVLINAFEGIQPWLRHMPP